MCKLFCGLSWADLLYGPICQLARCYSPAFESEGGAVERVSAVDNFEIVACPPNFCLFLLLDLKRRRHCDQICIFSNQSGHFIKKQPYSVSPAMNYNTNFDYSL